MIVSIKLKMSGSPPRLMLHVEVLPHVARILLHAARIDGVMTVRMSSTMTVGVVMTKDLTDAEMIVIAVTVEDTVMVEDTKVDVMVVAIKAAGMIIVAMAKITVGVLVVSPPRMLTLLVKSVTFMDIPPRSVGRAYGDDRGDNGDRSGEKGANFASQGVDTNWYYDIGATDHITGELNKLTTHDAYNGQDCVRTAESTCMHISHIGHSVVCTPHNSFHLNDILHVPSA
jgi:hypothetical protein